MFFRRLVIVKVDLCGPLLVLICWYFNFDVQNGDVIRVCLDVFVCVKARAAEWDKLLLALICSIFWQASENCGEKGQISCQKSEILESYWKLENFEKNKKKKWKRRKWCNKLCCKQLYKGYTTNQPGRVEREKKVKVCRATICEAERARGKNGSNQQNNKAPRTTNQQLAVLTGRTRH